MSGRRKGKERESTWEREGDGRMRWNERRWNEREKKGLDRGRKEELGKVASWAWGMDAPVLG